MPVHSHPILFSDGPERGALWGNKVYGSGNYGSGAIGISGYADTAFKGGNQAIDITNKGYNVIFYVCV